MLVIRPNCRIQFTAEDLEFILTVLSQRVSDRDSLLRLLGEEETRDMILDNETLLHAVLERRACLRISSHFYFYVLVRGVFRRAGLDDRALADYVAELLAQCCRSEARQARTPAAHPPLEYFVDLLAALNIADDTTRFLIRAHIGNTSLFLSGIFPDRIRWRTERRAAPSLRYYEDLGRASFRAASDHRLAREYELEGVFDTLAERFQDTRLALNDLRERLLSMGDEDVMAETALQAAWRNLS